MKITNIRNSIEALFIFIIIFSIITIIAKIFGEVGVYSLFHYEDIKPIEMHHMMMSQVWLGLKLIVNIAVAFWLSYKNRDNVKTRILWFLIGLLFDLMGVILYYIIQMHEYLKNIEENTKTKKIKKTTPKK